LSHPSCGLDNFEGRRFVDDDLRIVADLGLRRERVEVRVVEVDAVAGRLRSCRR
jgi:hypothetical protein